MALLFVTTMCSGCATMMGTMIGKSFPGEIAPSKYESQVVTDGVRSTFRTGVTYRYPGMVPMLEVSGSYYEMGLQYGVLLRPEIMQALESYGRIIDWMAAQENISAKLLTGMMYRQSHKLAQQIPVRFHEEIRGVAEGSGVSEETIWAIALIYDVLQGQGCTGLLMKGEQGTILHGRNQDVTSFGGEELAKLTVIVRHKPDGYHTVTHTDWALFMGVQTGYNSEGLAFSEETLSVRKPQPDNYSLSYLAREALETCSTLQDLESLFDRSSVINGYGTVWSDRPTGRGMVVELTPQGWAKIPLNTAILWNFNHIYTPYLQPQENFIVALLGSDADREAVAAAFPKKPVYVVEDAVNFLRSQEDAQGVNYAWYGSKTPICNFEGQQMVVFDPKMDGFYFATGVYYAARQTVYHIFEDFSRQPEVFMAAVPLEPYVEAVAQIFNRLIDEKLQRDQLLQLLEAYPDNANLHFLIADRSIEKKDEFIFHAIRAHQLAPQVSEYAYLAGIAALWQQNDQEAAALLETVTFAGLVPYKELLRLALLEHIYAARHNAERAQYYATQKQTLLTQYHAQEFFEDVWQRLSKRLNIAKR